MRNVVIAVLSIAVIFMIAAGVACCGRMFMPLWLPVGAAVLVAGATAPVIGPRWRRLLRWPVAACCVAHVLVVGSAVFAAVTVSNFAVERPDTRRTVRAVVDGHFTEERTRYRRVGRNRQVPAGHYNTYHLRLRLPDGHTFTDELPFEAYRRCRDGRRVPVGLYTGLWGYTVIDFNSSNIISMCSNLFNVSPHELCGELSNPTSVVMEPHNAISRIQNFIHILHNPIR